MDIQKINKGVSSLEKHLSKVSALRDRNKNLIISCLFILHLGLSIFNKDFTWLSAFGGLITTIGLLLVFFQTSLLDHKKDYDELHIEQEVTEQIVTGGMVFGEVSTKDEIPEKLKELRLHYSRKYQNLRYYFWLTVCGTLIWAYAGFFNFIFECNK